MVLKHLLNEVYETVAGGLGSCERAAEGETFTCENALILTGNSLVLAEHVAYLPAADADVTCGNVGVGTYNPVKSCHEALAETHNFHLALALGVKVGAALTAAYRQSGQRVLENLLKAEELDYAHVNRRMEAQTALIGADGAVELNAVAAVCVNLAVVISPRYAENRCSLRLNYSLKQSPVLIGFVGIYNGTDGVENLCRRLHKFRLCRIFLLNMKNYVINIAHINHCSQ